MSSIGAPVTGSVVQVLATPGAVVRTGDELAIIESMKMEIPVEAPHDGTVTDVLIGEGDHVEEGQEIIRLAE